MSEAVSVAFLALAAGSLLYVVMQLMHVNRQLGHTVLVTWMLRDCSWASPRTS